MQRLLMTAAVLGLVSLSLAPSASAAAAGCAVLAPGPAVPVGLAVPAPYPNALAGPCAGGLVFTSATPPCPLNLAPIALPGEYCGAVPGFGAGVTVTCTGVVAGPNTTFKALVIGLDAFPWDGNIAPPEPLAYEGVYGAATHSAKIANPGPLPARVIAYPTDVAGPGPILVNCI